MVQINVANSLVDGKVLIVLLLGFKQVGQRLIVPTLGISIFCPAAKCFGLRIEWGLQGS